jgi:hypothetical protein
LIIDNDNFKTQNLRHKFRAFIKQCFGTRTGMHFGSGLGKRFGLGAEIKWNEKIPHRQVKNFPGKKLANSAASNIKRA